MAVRNKEVKLYTFFFLRGAGIYSVCIRSMSVLKKCPY